MGSELPRISNAMSTITSTYRGSVMYFTNHFSTGCSVTSSLFASAALVALR